MKRVGLALSMAVCLFSLSACATESVEDKKAAVIDQQTADYISQATEGLLQSITALDKETATEMEATLQDQKETELAGGVSSWLGVMDDTGMFISIDTPMIEENGDDGYTCTIQTQFENRRVEFEIVYEWETDGLMPASITFTPEYSVAESMSKAGMNTLIGMGTVFLVLIFISFLIGCFKYINKFEMMLAGKKEAAPAPAVAPKAATPAPAAEDLTSDLELVAVITAAIRATEGMSSTDGLVVRSIKRVPGAKWKRA